MSGKLFATLEEVGEEDPVFISLADLFSLLSLTVIYVVLTFGQTVPSASAEPVVASTLEGSGPGKPINPEDTYVSVQSNGPTIVFRITRQGVEVDKEAPMDMGTSKIPEQWLLSSLGEEARNGAIFLYLPPGEDSMAVKALFTDTARLLKAHFTNLHVAL